MVHIKKLLKKNWLTSCSIQPQRRVKIILIVPLRECYTVSKNHLFKGCVLSAVLSRSVVSSSLSPHRLQPARLLCPWDSPGKDTRVGCHALVQGIFPIQGWNPGLLNCRQIRYHLSHQGSPYLEPRDNLIVASSTSPTSKTHQFLMIRVSGMKNVQSVP